ncbi:MAG: glycosyltransferase [Chitinophagaceae bacterium]|nr:glycosyltransferase [Chitinophagaceae bacterium]
MTVLFCLSHIKKSLQWFWFAEQLKKEGINQVYVIIDINSDEDLYLCDDLSKLDLPVYKLPHTGKWSHIKNMLMVSDLIKEYNVDLIHSSLPFGNLVGQVAGRMAGLNKLVTTCENVSWAHDFNNKKQERLDKFTFKTAQRVIATSDVARKYLDENWDFDKSKLSTIYHGVNPADYEVSPERIQAIREQLKDLNLENSFVVGVLSRFEFWKGHQFIIEAARLLDDYPDIRFFIFGVKGSFYDEAMQLIEQYGLKDKVVYGGFVNDTSALYQLFDVHLHVPIDEHVETGGITIIEGMMAQRPQILTLSGYAYQSARHMENAYVVPFKDAEAIAKAVLFMKQNPEEAKRMATQAKKDAYAFSVQEKTRMHISLYQELLS